MIELYDVTIIGAGVVGCAIARELTKYKLKILVLEKESDVGEGISKANSGVVHAGFNNDPGSLKAELCVKGNRIFPKICAELDVPFKRIGKLVVALTDDEIEELYKLKEKGEKNGVEGLQIIDKNTLRKMEPHVNGVAALFSPSSGITNPFLLTIGYAENAIMNGAHFRLNSEVISINEKREYFKIKIRSGESFKTRFVINSAGLYSDIISKMVGISKYHIHPCRGEYVILDKKYANLINHLVYPVPPKDVDVLGVHLTPTIEGPILVGPSSQFIEEREGTNTTREMLETILSEAMEILPSFPNKGIIRNFAGVRPKIAGQKEGGKADFIIEESDVENFIILGGIESPGLTAATPIARKVVEIISKKIDLVENESFNPYRQGIKRFSELSPSKKAELINKDENYGEIICRCEQVTKAELLSALNNPLGVKTLNGIKKRIRATAGRCQGGFCLPRIVEILEKQLKDPVKEITLKGKGSELFVRRVR
ncbi:MAG: NAD(P)/FAD-dependent oxidoreductase [Candidatus Odinarchaeia archaeon]